MPQQMAMLHGRIVIGRETGHFGAEAERERPLTSGRKPRKRGNGAKRAKHPAEPGPLGRLVRGVFRLIWSFVWRVALVLGILTAGATGYYFSILPPSDELFDGRGTGSVILRDINGEIFAWRGEQYGGEIRADRVSPHLVNAVLAAEDKRFYMHPGIDPQGILRALMVNLRAGRVVQGGSSITQQVAKLLFLDADRSIDRKLREIPIALALELKYTKEEILSVYMNRVYLGAGTFGFEAAAQRYFGKSARVVDPAEAAMLAGLLRAPSRYAPTNDLAQAQGRASVIVRLMEEQGYLTQAQTVEALANPAVLSDSAAARAGGAFADWIMEAGAEDRFLHLLQSADVEIETTFDPDVQRGAEQALRQVFEEKVKDGSEAQAAIVVMTHDGAVRAMVGGRERGAAQFNRATQALRQPGSAFKPIVYAAGLEAGLRPLDVFQDAPIRIGNWSPSNYSNSFRGPVTLREALVHSINTVAVRVAQHAGIDQVRELGQRLGLDTPIAPGPAIALGTSEVRLIDMTGVYATIANGGRRVRPNGVASIRLRGDKEPIHVSSESIGEQVLSERAAGFLTGMMMGVVEEGTGRRARLPGREVAGKTGTTQSARDAWFIGFTADHVVGVWMGYDDNSPLTGVTGGGLPAEIWREVMVRIEEGKPPRPLKALEPERSQIVLGPASGEVASDAPSGGGLFESILNDVVRTLGGNAPSQAREWEPPVSGADR